MSILKLAMAVENSMEVFRGREQMERSENQSELSRRLCTVLSGKGQMLDNLLSGPSPMLPVECLMGCDFTKNIHRPLDPSLQGPACVATAEVYMSILRKLFGYANLVAFNFIKPFH